jgi:membrane-bound lytic murein transglycosylase A
MKNWFRVFPALGILLVLASCTQPATPVVEPPGAPPLVPVSVQRLPGWRSDDTSAALLAFLRGCKALTAMPADQMLGGRGLPATAGEAGQWLTVCAAAEAVPAPDEAAAKQFFEHYFAAYQITEPALITGYFEPEYPGSKNPAPGDHVPLWSKPADPALASLPRAAIDAGALEHHASVAAYLADPVEAFMLQIQGSGRILLQNGQTLRVGFDGQNGLPYTPIGRILVQEGDLKADEVNFQTISAWLKAHPDEAQSVMEENSRYVFMRPLGFLPDDEGAPGTLGVPLTPGRSLAIDAADIPLGIPVFIATTNPLTNASIDRLTMAQDTGGGIHGAHAADLFFGKGPEIEAIAGRMQQSGTLYLLLPKSVPNS